jgi:diacylglycerol kinase family enzyme
MRNWLAIVNPHSGGLTGHSRLNEIVAFLRREQAEVVLTEHAGHATELAQTASRYDGVITAGGDGIIFEVLQGLRDPAQPLLTIPGGRGNSLARDLGLYPFIGRLSRATRNRQIDLLSVRYQTADGETHECLSASTIATGFIAEVAELAGRRLRGLRSFSYLAAGACCRPRARSMTVRYGAAPAERKQVTGFLISNTRHAACFVPFPEADCTDGVFEAMELSAGVVRQSLHSLSTLSGKSLFVPPTRIGLTEARLTMDTPETLLVDGELFPEVVSLEVQVLPAARTCVTAA